MQKSFLEFQLRFSQGFINSILCYYCVLLLKRTVFYLQSITGEAYTRLSEEALDNSLLAIDNSHFDEKKQPTAENVNSPESPPMMSSTYKELSAFQGGSSVNNVTPPEKKGGERPEQLNLMDLNLMDTKPYIQSPCENEIFPFYDFVMIYFLYYFEY